MAAQFFFGAFKGRHAFNWVNLAKLVLEVARFAKIRFLHDFKKLSTVLESDVCCKLRKNQVAAFCRLKSNNIISLSAIG